MSLIIYILLLLLGGGIKLALPQSFITKFNINTTLLLENEVASPEPIFNVNPHHVCSLDIVENPIELINALYNVTAHHKYLQMLKDDCLHSSNYKFPNFTLVSTK